jgi:hypothetical protein
MAVRQETGYRKMVFKTPESLHNISLACPAWFRK